MLIWMGIEVLDTPLSSQKVEDASEILRRHRVEGKRLSLLELEICKKNIVAILIKIDFFSLCSL